MDHYSAISLRVLLFWILLLLTSVSAHMAMSDPPPLRYKTNPYSTNIDYSYSSPLSSSGSDFPCKGYQVDMGTPSGQSVTTWSPGGMYTLQLAGSAPHGGGSCQASLSYDKGASWSVIKSWIGACANPDPSGSQTFGFTLPTGIPSGDVLFAWTWFNEIGNREMYMNCAVVTISGASGRRRRSRSLSTPVSVSETDFSSLSVGAGTDRSLLPRTDFPPLFTANIDNGCSTAAGTDVVFPNAGTQVTYGGSEANRAPPVGNCAAGTDTSLSTGGTSTDSSGESASSASGTSSAQPSSYSSGASGTYTSGTASSESSSYTSGSNAAYSSGTTSAGTSGYSSGANAVNNGGTTSVGALSDTSGTSAGGLNSDGTSGGKDQCDYWKSVGYLCSDAASRRLEKGLWWKAGALIVGTGFVIGGMW
ncbi:hypothetical protein RUND412_009132 [Rhizina undulata]